MILFGLQKMQCPLIVVTAFLLLLSLSSNVSGALSHRSHALFVHSYPYKAVS